MFVFVFWFFFCGGVKVTGRELPFYATQARHPKDIRIRIRIHIHIRIRIRVRVRIRIRKRIHIRIRIRTRQSHASPRREISSRPG